MLQINKTPSITKINKQISSEFTVIPKVGKRITEVFNFRVLIKNRMKQRRNPKYEATFISVYNI